MKSGASSASGVTYVHEGRVYRVRARAVMASGGRPMASDLGQALRDRPQYALLRDIVSANIGEFPEIIWDRAGLAGHRVRLFESGVWEIRFSERALARYIELADLILVAKDKTSTNSSRVV